MAFTEEQKKQVRRKAAYHCCVCQQPALSVEVHHIIPQEEGGPDELDNAAPLCPSCHSDYGGNKEKRTRIREIRDFWYEQVARRYKTTDIGTVESMEQKVSTSEKNLPEIKEELREYIEETINKITPQNVEMVVSSILSSTVAVPAAPGMTPAVAMWDRLTKLESENTSLKSELSLKKSLTYRNGAHRADGDSEPYCSRCWEVDGRQVHLHQMGNPAFYECPNCKSGSVKARPDRDEPPTAHVFYPDYR